MCLVDRLRKILVEKQIIKSMVIKNFKDKYSGSVLGILWPIINPLLITLAIVFVFTRIMKSEVKHYPVFVLSGLLPWFFFVNSICESTNSMRQNLDILNQFVIPKEIVPISVVLSNFINFLLGFIIIIPIFIIFNLGIIKFLPLLPFIMLLHFIFTLGISMLFSILNVYFRDLSQLLNVGTMFLFWVTPIFYTMEIIPSQYHWIILTNPAFSCIAIYQSLLYKGSPGAIYLWLLSIGFSLLSLISGYVFFLKKEGEILKYIR